MASVGPAELAGKPGVRRCGMSQYIDADTLDEIRNAYGCGIPLERLAAQVGVSEDDLRRLLGLPQWKTLPQQTELDLWAVDRLHDVL